MRIPAAARGNRRVQPREPRAEARTGADPGQVRHLLHRPPHEPGRRAGAVVYRRQHSGQPRRHRDGAGADDQSRAGGRARTRRRPGARRRHRDAHRQNPEHLADRGLKRRRHQRHGRAQRRANHQAAAARAPRREARRRRGGNRFRRRPHPRRRRDAEFRAGRRLGAPRARAVVRRRLLQNAKDLLRPRARLRAAVLLLRRRRGRLRSVDRHADRRIQTAARRHRARRRQLHQSGDGHRAD